MPQRFFGRKSAPAATPQTEGATLGADALPEPGRDGASGYAGAARGVVSKSDYPSAPRSNGVAPHGAPAFAFNQAGPFRPDATRRVVDVAIPAYRRLPNGNGNGNGYVSANGTDARKLIVGRDISLCGDISACDMLVVEGMVEATLRDGRLMEITETGFFKGNVEVDEADLAGRFEGTMLVRGRMRIRSTGRISGTIRYGELEVEAGGQVMGDIQVATPGYHAVVDRKPSLAEGVGSAGPVSYTHLTLPTKRIV